MTTATNIMTLPKLLDGMPQGVKHDCLIPWAAALRVVVPLIEINDPKRATAIPLFEEWVKDRDQEISVEQTAWLWDNFCTHFAKETTQRFTQWAHDPTAREVKNPLEIGRMQFRIWREVHFNPWKVRLQKTFWGRMGYRLLQCLGFVLVFSIVFPFFFVLAGLATWVLIEIRDPLRAGLAHLGLL